MNETVLVNRSDFSDLTVVVVNDTPLADGCVRARIGPWALTANNITYMVTGDLIGYWDYFEPSHYGLDTAGLGRMPVWGFATITESRCDDIPEGTVIYGFFPVAKRIDLKPVNISPLGFHDGTDHRVKLHPIYNSYTRVDADPSFAGNRDLQPVLRPLFTTSFLIDDFLADEDMFGADQVLLLSASSKTAMGTAFCLKARGGIAVAGLTSSGNADFVKETEFYDTVATYDALTDLDPTFKTVIVDMAGNGDVLAKVYAHFGENIVYNCMVGKSHWQGASPPKPEAGAPPVMFFAPDRAKLRVGQWGGEGFAKKLGARWVPFCDSAQNWLDIEQGDGVTDFMKIYKAFLDGAASPAKGYLFSL